MQDEFKTEQERRDYWLKLAEQAFDAAIRAEIIYFNALSSEHLRFVEQVKAAMAERHRINKATESQA